MNPLLTQLKCRSCQGDLDPNTAHGGVIECKFCGSLFTLPKSENNDDVMDSLKDAERELERGHFEAAFQTYQRVSEECENEPEAYFGMAIANAKVQYLNSLREDEETGEPKKCLQPICYEIIDKKFTEDRNYKKALDLATPEQKLVYAEKGKEIDDIRKKFNELKNSGVTYDCFICTKVSEIDNKNRHTEDCYDAEQLYSSIKEAGYNPFFSEKVLKKGLGVDYEAYILYALYSSPCMIIVCNDEAYLRTPWVQNEYTRFLQMIKNEEKHLNSITFAFKNGHIIEKLPGVNGKIQGVAIDSFGAKDQIIDFVSRFSEARNRIPDIDRKEYGKVSAAKKNVIEQQIKKRELKIEKRGVVTASDQANLDTIQNFLDQSDFNTASSMAKKLTQQSPKLSAAYWLLELADTETKDSEEFIAKNKKISSFDNFEKAISTESDEKKRKVYYDALYERVKRHKFLNEYEEYISLPESDPKKIDELSDIMYKDALDSKDEKTFKTVIKTITNTDKYINMNKEFLSKVPSMREFCYSNILEVDKADSEALYENFAIKNLSNKKGLPEFLKDDKNFGTLEKEVYSYGFNDYATDLVFRQVIDLVRKEDDEQAGKIFDFVLKMIPKNKDTLFVKYLQEFIDNLLGFAGSKRKPNFDMASRYNELLLQTDKHNYDACFNRFLIKHRINNLIELVQFLDFMKKDEDYLAAITQFNEVHPEERKNNKYVLLLKVIESYIPLLEDPDEKDDVLTNTYPTKEEIFNYADQIKAEIELYHQREDEKASDARKKEIESLKSNIKKKYGDFCRKYRLAKEDEVFSIKKNVSKDPILFEIKELAEKLAKLSSNNELTKVEKIINTQKSSAYANTRKIVVNVSSAFFIIATLAAAAMFLLIPICGFLGYNSSFYVVAIGIFKNNLSLILYMILGIAAVALQILIFKKRGGYITIFLYLIPLAICAGVAGMSYNYKQNTKTVYYDSAMIMSFKKNDDDSYTLAGLATLKDFDGGEEFVLPESYNDMPVTTVGKKFNNGINYKEIKKLIVPESYTKIEKKAFSGNKRIYEIDVGDSVTEVGDLAFYKCTNLKTLTLGDGIKTIPFSSDGMLSHNMFEKCKNLTTIYFGSGLEEISMSAFQRNQYITEVHIKSGTAVANFAFSSSSIQKVVFEKVEENNEVKTTSIGSWAFMDCASLKEVDFVDADGNTADIITSIGSGAFENCTSLTRITITGSVTKINDDAFKDSGLTTANITGTWTTGSGIFAKNVNFNSMTAEDAAKKLKEGSALTRK